MKLNLKELSVLL